jgi:hypothetical protein
MEPPELLTLDVGSEPTLELGLLVDVVDSPVGAVVAFAVPLPSDVDGLPVALLVPADALSVVLFVLEGVLSVALFVSDDDVDDAPDAGEAALL